MSRDAITVEPNIRFEKDLTLGAHEGETLILDSGEDDLNRTISRKTMPNADVQEFEVSGFSQPYYFKDESSMLKAINSLVEKSKEGPLADFVLASDSITKTDYCLTFGDTSIIYLLNEDTTKSIKKRIASPIYRIYPNKKGDYLDFSDFQNCIKNSWQLAFYDAIAPKESQTTVSKVVKDSSVKDGIDAHYLLKGLFLFLIIVAAMLVGSAVAKSKVKGEPLSTSIMAPALTGLTNMSTSANSNNANALQEQLQVDQTKKLLKQMNIDLDANPQDMGCFTN